MLSTKKFIISLLGICLIGLYLVFSPALQAQNWMALPPYNTLWPLWSPALSPIDPLTGLPEPLVTELFPDTLLPVEPGLTWDPTLAYPWLLYNSPFGLAYYDPFFGVNLWPPSYLLDAIGDPLPLILPTDYEFLPPIASPWLFEYLPLANAAALLYLESNFGPLVPPPVYLDALALI